MDRIRDFRRDNYLRRIPKLSFTKPKESWKHKRAVIYNDGDREEVREEIFVLI